METAIKPRKICNPFLPLHGASEPDELHQVAIDLYAIWRDWDNVGQISKWEFENFAHSMRMKSCSWYEVGLMAYMVKVQKLYEPLYTSFRQFCEDFLQKTSSCINNWIRAAFVINQLIAEGFKDLPLSSSVALAIGTVTGGDGGLIGDLWRDLLDNYPIHQITAGVVQEFYKPRESKPKTKILKVALSKWEKLRELAVNAGITPSRMLDSILNSFLGVDEGDERNLDEKFLQTKQKSNPTNTITKYSELDSYGSQDLKMGFLDEIFDMFAYQHDQQEQEKDLANDGGSTTGQTEDGIEAEKMEIRNAAAERVTSDNQTLQERGGSSHGGDTLSQGQDSGKRNVLQNPQKPKSQSLPPIHIASDTKQREQKATRTLQKVREDYRRNPIRHEIPLPGRKPKCLECRGEENLIGCFNIVNLSQIPDFWYCSDHVEEFCYCRGCGRYSHRCACDF